MQKLTPPQTVTFLMDGLNDCQKVGMLQIAKVTLQVFSNGFLLIKALWQELRGGYSLFRLVYFCILLYDNALGILLKKQKICHKISHGVIHDASAILWSFFCTPPLSNKKKNADFPCTSTFLSLFSQSIPYFLK